MEVCLNAQGHVLTAELELIGWGLESPPKRSREAFLKAPRVQQELVLIGLLLQRAHLQSLPHSERRAAFTALVYAARNGAVCKTPASMPAPRPAAVLSPAAGSSSAAWPASAGRGTAALPGPGARLPAVLTPPAGPMPAAALGPEPGAALPAVSDNSLPQNARPAAAAAAAEVAAALGGGSYQDLLAWAYSPASGVTRADCDPAFLESFVACSMGAQRVALGYLVGRVQQGLFDGMGRRSCLMATVLREVAKQVSEGPPFLQLEQSLFLASAPGDPRLWHKQDVGGSEALDTAGKVIFLS